MGWASLNRWVLRRDLKVGRDVNVPVFREWIPKSGGGVAKGSKSIHGGQMGSRSGEEGGRGGPECTAGSVYF